MESGLESVLITRDKEGRIIAITINDIGRRIRVVGSFKELDLDEIKTLFDSFAITS